MFETAVKLIRIIVRWNNVYLQLVISGCFATKVPSDNLS